jgi:carboxymethylenebutenolidase
MRATSVTVLALVLAAGAAPLAAAPHSAGDDYAATLRTMHAHETASASPATEPEPARAVKSEEVVYATLEGKPVVGYLARPAASGQDLPALIVIQEWWGLNDNMRAMTRRLAGEGYVALAVDLYEGVKATNPKEAQAAVESALAQMPRLTENLRQARAYLGGDKIGARKVGVVGWCFGGGWSLATALDLGDRIDAAVLYYGRVVTDPKELAKLQAPLLGHFGAADDSIPVARVREFEAALKQAGKPAEIHVYEGAGHAFANPSGQSYQERAATESWQRTVAFFARHLKAG